MRCGKVEFRPRGSKSPGNSAGFGQCEWLPILGGHPNAISFLGGRLGISNCLLAILLGWCRGLFKLAEAFLFLLLLLGEILLPLDELVIGPGQLVPLGKRCGCDSRMSRERRLGLVATRRSGRR